MEQALVLGDLIVDVVRKDIKNLHLSVHPLTGRHRATLVASCGDSRRSRLKPRYVLERAMLGRLQIGRF